MDEAVAGAGRRFESFAIDHFDTSMFVLDEPRLLQHTGCHCHPSAADAEHV